MRAIAFAAIAAASLVIVRASGPIGVYALVDKITFEPNAEKPERIRISGVFITAKDQNSDSYSDPQRGYLYFTLPQNNAGLARREWSDLKTVAGTGQVVGFGSSWFGKVRVRQPDEAPASPGEYPMGNGLVKINRDHPKAKALLEYR
jgi:hypothetical protein